MTWNLEDFEAWETEAPLVLTEQERQTLERWARRRISAQAMALRARIVLACAEGTTNKAVAERLGVWPQTVAKWRGRFVRERLEGLADEPRAGRLRTVADAQVEEVIVKALEEPLPHHDTQWSTRSMARATGLSQTAIRHYVTNRTTSHNAGALVSHLLTNAAEWFRSGR